MHDSVVVYVARHVLLARDTDVLEVGSYDVNGGVRSILAPLARKYVGIDVEASRRCQARIKVICCMPEELNLGKTVNIDCDRGIAGQKYIQENYSWARVLKKYEEVFSFIILAKNTSTASSPRWYSTVGQRFPGPTTTYAKLHSSC